MLGDFVDEVVGGLRLVAQAQALHDVGEAHKAQADGAVLAVGEVGLLYRRARDVDEVVELTHSQLGALFELGPVNFAVHDVARQVDRREVTHRHVVFVLRERDLGAQVGRVDRSRVVVEGAQVDRVFPREPRVARGLQRNQDGLELLARTDLLEHVDASGVRLGHVVVVAVREFLAVELVEVGDLKRVEEVPVVVVLDALHELVANPHGGVGRARATVGITRVLTQIEELREVHVPVLHVEAQGTELLATAAHGTKDRVDRVHEGDGAGGRGVVRADGRTLGTKLADGEADATRSLGEPHDVARGLGDVLHVVLHFHDEAVGQLGVNSAGVNECGSGGQVLERAHLGVEADGVLGGVGLVERQAHGDAHPEVLGNLERVAVATFHAVAVVERDHTDVLEQVVVFWREVLGQFIEVEEFAEAGVEQTFLNAAQDVGGEVLAVQGHELLTVAEVAEDTLVDGLEQESGSHNVERGVVFDVLQGNLDDCLVELLGRDAVKQRDFKLGGNLGHPRDRVVQTRRRLFNGEVDLVCVIRFPLTVALYDCD